MFAIEPNDVYKSNFLNNSGGLKGKIRDISGEENDYLKAISLITILLSPLMVLE